MKGFLFGCAFYLLIGVIYFVLAGGGRGGDMPFGAEIFIWLFLMFPLGLIGVVAPAFEAMLSNQANETFGTFHAIEYAAMAGNFLLWGLGGALIGKALPSKGS